MDKKHAFTSYRIRFVSLKRYNQNKAGSLGKRITLVEENEIPEEELENQEDLESQNLAAEEEQTEERPDFDSIGDVPMIVTAQLGETQILIRDLLQLGIGSVVELTKFAGEPTDLLVNTNMIAKGEIVVSNEKYALRLTDVINK